MKKKKINADEILIDDIKEVKTVKLSTYIKEENIHHISYEIEQIGDNIQTNDDGNK